MKTSLCEASTYFVNLFFCTCIEHNPWFLLMWFCVVLSVSDVIKRPIKILADVLTGNLIINPASIYFFKVNNKNTRKRCKKCSKLTIKTPEWRHGFKLVNVSWEKGVYMLQSSRNELYQFPESINVFSCTVSVIFSGKQHSFFPKCISGSS